MASIIPVFVPHAGCPCQCVFCNQKTIAGQKQHMTAQQARDILQTGLSVLPAAHPAPQAAFYGGSFTAIPQEQQDALLAVTDDLIAQGKLSSVRCSTRPDAITPEILQRMKAHHVTTIELGAQSMSEQVLKASGRGHTAQDTIRAAQMIKQADISLILQMMVGLPADTRERTRETARRIAACSPDGVRIYPTAVLPDTPLYAMWKNGSYAPLTNETAAEWCADALEIFQAEHIPVIRIGLNPTEELDSAVAAGAYHPAMGELVYSAVWYRRLRARALCGETQLFVPKREISRAVGHKRCNILRLQQEFPNIRIIAMP